MMAIKSIDDPYFNEELFAYFPKIMQKKFADEILNHQLKREIIATQITNFIVNYVGINFTSQIAKNRGFKIDQVVKATIICIEAFELKKFWQEIENIEEKISHELKIEMFLSATHIIERSILWILNNRNSKNLSENIEKLKLTAKNFFKVAVKTIDEPQNGNIKQKIEQLTSLNINQNLAYQFA